MTSRKFLTPFDELRAVNAHLEHCQQTEVLCARSPHALVKAVRALWATGWDVYLDQLTLQELNAAAAGEVNWLANSLNKRLGGDAP